MRLNARLLILFCLLNCCVTINAQDKNTCFKVIAFYTAKEDPAHISFVHEANKWFLTMAAKYHLIYDSSNNWSNLNAAFLSHYQVVLFLNTRPDSAVQKRCV